MGPCVRRDDTEVVAILSRLTSRAHRLRRRLPQTLPAQTILALDRHRQARRFLRAPAGAREIAAEFGAATGAGEAARFRQGKFGGKFFRICHDLPKGFAVIFMPGSSPATVY